jgi:transposase-like protein
MIYKVWINIEEIDESKDHYLDLGTPYEAGKFDTEAEAVKFVENELMIIRTVNTKLQQACQAGLKFLDSLSKTELTTELQNREAFRKILNDALNQNIPTVNDSCPRCGAGSDERDFTGKDFIGIEAIHMHYTCKKCNSEITEEFTLTDVFIDDPPV